MYIRQTDLFWGLNQNVVNRVMAMAERVAFAKGDVLFHSGDEARHLFILAQGEVKITIGDTGKKVYTGNRVGEAFGWKCLIDGDKCGGDAICATPVVVLKLDRDRLLRLLDSDTQSGYLFYKHLSRALGERLIQAYQQMADTDVGGNHGKS
ncbi:Crp/Fnr family transcriptional regulator [Desulfosarcina sp.]|uniref:Crp/Fnr family transcriptional regulator n=1 Tax=Desulfosarcina sp. TaxID=2027861 RepID=UPI003561DA20